MEKMILDEHKICFISCVNDEAKYKQCSDSLQLLSVPDNMCVEYMVLRGFTSMTGAYQKAMQQSDAKYKIYLHQDVHILHRRMLQQLIDCFQKNPQYGIAGVVGSATIPANGIWWQSTNLVGGIYDDHAGSLQLYKYKNKAHQCIECKALDGLLLATQYDIDWRTDIFGRWHFYDLSQCMEFVRSGYKVVVLPQLMPWCEHHCGQNTLASYDEERMKFLREYGREI